MVADQEDDIDEVGMAVREQNPADRPDRRPPKTVTPVMPVIAWDVPDSDNNRNTSAAPAALPHDLQTHSMKGTTS